MDEVLEVVRAIGREVIAPSAVGVDRDGVFPRASIDALAAAGLLGLTSATDVGGRGASLADATAVVREVAAHCGSTAMILMMHYAATAVLEAHGDRTVREEIAAGRHLSTLAFSEAGSRSHFWSPTSTAKADGDQVVLDAHKSWVTSSSEADSYVWSSQPLRAGGQMTLWYVPAASEGLVVSGPFDGLGLRGNDSNPVTATGVRVPAAAMLGEDGTALEAIALPVVLVWFLTMNAAVSQGTMDAVVATAIGHLTSTRLEHLDRTLAQDPIARAELARMKLRADTASAFLADTLTALATGREDAQLRLLEVKAVAAEAALEVTDLAMKVCGGAAFRRDLGVERRFRDSRAARVMAPTTDALRDFIGRALTGLDLFDGSNA